MRNFTILLAGGLLLLFTGAFQQTPPIRVEVDRVNVFVTVFDKDGHFVRNLGRDRFIVYEDSIPQEITNFSSEMDRPLRIGLLMDTSGSVRLKLAFEKESAIRFLRGVMRRSDEALLVEFDQGVSLLHDFTNRTADIERQIEGLRSGGGTALWDAVYTVSRDKMTDRDARKTIVVVSDGDDRNSQRSLEEALEMAQISEVTTYAIGTNNFGASSSKRGKSNLEELADQTGGSAFFPYTPERLDEAFEQINSELRSQYSITYVPRDKTRDGRFRRIEVRIKDGKGLKLRHRRGYRLPEF
ncbi:MAG: VWA domain-containing protein [Acidobacteriota bacterium]